MSVDLAPITNIRTLSSIDSESVFTCDDEVEDSPYCDDELEDQVLGVLHPPPLPLQPFASFKRYDPPSPFTRYTHLNSR